MNGVQLLPTRKMRQRCFRCTYRTLKRKSATWGQIQSTTVATLGRPHKSRSMGSGMTEAAILTAICPRPSPLAPGTRTGKIPLSLRFDIGQPNTALFDKLNLTPGKHSIRVRASVGDFPVITLVSNSVTVEVPSPQLIRWSPYEMSQADILLESRIAWQGTTNCRYWCCKNRGTKMRSNPRLAGLTLSVGLALLSPQAFSQEASDTAASV